MGSLWLICYTALPALSIVKAGKLKVVNSESSRAYLSDQWDNNFEIWFLESSNIFCTLFLFSKSLIHESKSLCRYAKRPRDWLSNLASAQPFPCLAQFPKMAIIICLYFYLVLRLHEADLKWKRRPRVVPHFSSGIGERAKREGAWKSPHRVGWFSETTARDIQYLISSAPINQARFYICASLSLLSGFHFYAYVHVTSHTDVRGGSQRVTNGKNIRDLTIRQRLVHENVA